MLICRVYHWVRVIHVPWFVALEKKMDYKDWSLRKSKLLIEFIGLWLNLGWFGFACWTSSWSPICRQLVDAQVLNRFLAKKSSWKGGLSDLTDIVIWCDLMWLEKWWGLCTDPKRIWANKSRGDWFHNFYTMAQFPRFIWAEVSVIYPPKWHLCACSAVGMSTHLRRLFATAACDHHGPIGLWRSLQLWPWPSTTSSVELKGLQF